MSLLRPDLLPVDMKLFSFRDLKVMATIVRKSLLVMQTLACVTLMLLAAIPTLLTSVSVMRGTLVMELFVKVIIL